MFFYYCPFVLFGLFYFASGNVLGCCWQPRSRCHNQSNSQTIQDSQQNIRIAFWNENWIHLAGTVSFPGCACQAPIYGGYTQTALRFLASSNLNCSSLMLVLKSSEAWEWWFNHIRRLAFNSYLQKGASKKMSIDAKHVRNRYKRAETRCGQDRNVWYSVVLVQYCEWNMWRVH